MIVGVDVDSFKATLCAVPFDGGTPILVQARFRPDSKTGDALAYLVKVPAAMRSARELLAEASPHRFAVEPNVWFVERGFGASRHSDFIVGAFTGAIMASLAGITDDPVNLMLAGEWKRDVTGASGIGLTTKGVGNGNAKKEVANAACRELLETFLEVDSTDWTPDQLDAFGIAFCGRRLNARAAAA
jgi:Holliday junction resolvasome RuvABC endonuclease subunit